MDLHAWLSTRIDAIERLTETANFPSLVAETLRRCDADRRILARHNVDPAKATDRLWATACQGCGYYGDCDDPVTENLNDCPELLDLAHAHGLNEADIAELDRPEGPPVAYGPPGKSLSERLAELLDQQLDMPVYIEPSSSFFDTGVTLKAKKIGMVLRLSSEDLDNL